MKPQPYSPENKFLPLICRFVLSQQTPADFCYLEFNLKRNSVPEVMLGHLFIFIVRYKLFQSLLYKLCFTNTSYINLFVLGLLTTNFYFKAKHLVPVFSVQDPNQMTNLQSLLKETWGSTEEGHRVGLAAVFPVIVLKIF